MKLGPKLINYFLFAFHPGKESFTKKQLRIGTVIDKEIVNFKKAIYANSFDILDFSDQPVGSGKPRNHDFGGCMPEP